MKYVTRKWLNKDRSLTAMVSTNFKYNLKPKSYESQVDCEVKLSDCSRIVSLDFDCYSREGLEAAISKAKILEEEFKRLRESLEFARDGINGKEKKG